MSFFKQFPTQSYDFNLDGVLQNVVDIYRSVRVEGSSIDNATLYSDVLIRNGERPDRMSYRLYGTADYYWTFFIVNDHLHDGIGVWPMSQEDLHEYMEIEFGGYAISTFPTTNYNTDLGLREFPNSIAGKFDLGEQLFGSGNGARGTLVKKDLDLNQLVVQNRVLPTYAADGVTLTNVPDTTDTKAFIGDGDNITESVNGQTTGHAVDSHITWKYREAPHHYYTTGDIKQRPISIADSFTVGASHGLADGLDAMTSVSYVSNQAYMEELNVKRSRIRVIAPKYIEQFVEDFEELINE